MSFRHGYFTGAGYTYGAYSEPSPERLALLCLLRSHRPPDLAAPFSLLELGCGQGVHLCLQAANYPQARVVGLDCNPDHIAHARSLAAAAGLTNITFHQADVLELEPGADPALAGFDLVVAHGVLGWVSPEVGAAMLRLAAAALRPGGLLYLSYNTLPGWLPALPLQHTIRSVQAHGSEGLASLRQVQGLFGALQQAGARLFEAQPGLASRLEALAGLDPAYLLHEYNHTAWQPLYVNQVIEAARNQGLSYLGSANLAENFEGLLPEAYRQQLQQQEDPALRELVRDLLTNQAFRRDVYVKGRDPLWPRQALAALDALRLLRLADAEALAEPGAFTFPLGFGEVMGSQPWFQALMDELADQPVSLATLRGRHASTPLPELLQNLVLLIGRDVLAIVPPEREAAPAHRLNAVLAEAVAAGAPYRSLACTLTGNIRALSDIDLLAFHALLQGCPEPELAEALERRLRDLERQVMRKGQPVSDSERLQELQQLSERFLRRTAPLLRRLEVLP